jgi:Lipocalin-like domain
MTMKTIGVLALFVTVCGVSQTRSTDREKLVGAWHLVSIVGHDGKPVTSGVPTGMLIYTRDGHMSVQLMYPKSTNAVSNEYVLNGYEASFGSYDVNDATHTVTHHVQGSNTGDVLVGKDLPRAFQFRADGHLIIKSARADERWSVTWEHY